MTTGHVFIATSLDGFVARKDHQLDWLMKQDTQGDDQGYSEFSESIDGLVMGRGSYETLLDFDQEWPYTKPVVVLSRSLLQSDVPANLAGKVEVSALEPSELMKRLGEDGWSRAYIDGGKVVQSFIRLGLVEDIVLTTIPILIGDGLRLFGEVEGDIDLELLASKSFNSGLVQSHYRLKNS
jgi:dihydrofolate reductase